MKISLLDVTKEYRLDGKNKVVPVRGVTLDMMPGEFIMVVGRSGTGKTTLLNLAAGLVRPTSGDVLVDGVSYREMSDREVSALRCRRTGFIIQFPSLLPSLNILENVMMPVTFVPGRGEKQALAHARRLLDSVGLGGRMRAYPRHLSAGEQKRAVIARALMNDPELVLADEPTSDLDEETEQEIMDLLRNVQATGVVFLMVTHNLELIPFADRAFRMENGALTQLRPPTERIEEGRQAPAGLRTG